MLNKIVKRIKNHNALVSKYEKGKISDSEFEKHLLEEIEFVQQDIEDKLNNELLKEEQKLIENIKKIQDAIDSHNIDKKSLTNMIYSEFNHIPTLSS